MVIGKRSEAEWVRRQVKVCCEGTAKDGVSGHDRTFRILIVDVVRIICVIIHGSACKINYFTVADPKRARK